MSTVEEEQESGRAARRERRHAEALRHFERACELAPNLPALRIDCAQELFALGRIEEAERLYLELLGLLPNRPIIHRGLAQIAAHRGLIDAALEHYRQAMALGPALPWIASECVAMLRQAKRFDEAELVCAELDRANPEKPIAWMERMRTARARGLNEEMGQAAEQVLDRDPTSVEALSLLASALRSQGKTALAIAACDRLLALQPDHVPSHLIKAAAANEGGEQAKAQSILEQGLTRNPQSPPLMFELARLSRARGQYDRARELLLALRALKPEEAAYVRQLAGLEAEAGNSQASAAYKSELLKLDPGSLQTAIELVRHHISLGQREEARRILQESQSKGAPPASLLVELAELDAQHGDFDQALDTVAQALASEPDHFAALISRSRYLLNRGQFEEAFRALDEKHAVLSANPDYFARRAQFLQLTGSLPQAFDMIDKTLQAHPDHFGVLNQWMACAIRLGKFAAVHGEIERYQPANAHQTRQLNWMKAHLARAEGKHAEAHALLDTLAQTEGVAPQIHREAARAAIPLLAAEAARAHLRRFAERTRAQMIAQGRKTNPSQSLVGQIADEFLLDREALQAARKAAAKPASGRIAALLRAVAEYPEATCTAFALLVALRELGHFDIAPPVSKAKPGTIPRKIFQFWDGENPPEDIALYCRSWAELNPGFSYTRFSTASGSAYLKQHCPKPVQDAFRRLRSPAGKADILRMAVLHREGGIYCDADDRCVAPLEPVVAGTATFIGHQEDIGSIGNNFLAVAPGHPVIAHALEQASANIASGANDTIWLSTGPGQLSRSFALTLAAQGRNWRKWLDQAVIYNWTDLTAFSAPQCIAAYKNTNAHWSRFAKSANRGQG